MFFSTAITRVAHSVQLLVDTQLPKNSELLPQVKKFSGSYKSEQKTDGLVRHQQ